MDSNDCIPNHLDADVRLPPRKRLLAGLKKQSCSESTSPCSQVNNPSPNPSPSPSPSPHTNPNPSSSPSPSQIPSPLSGFDVRLKNLLKSYKNGSNMSLEEIAKAAISASEAATMAAKSARKEADEKAAMAAKAISDAKSALNSVANTSNSEKTSNIDKNYKKSKLKKHIPVQLLYKKNRPVENCGTDEELARKIHRAMNSSPRISKHSPTSHSKNGHKKLKISPPSEKSGVSNGANLRSESTKLPFVSDGDVVDDGMDYEGSNEETLSIKLDDKVEVDSGEVESSYSKERVFEVATNDTCINGRKRGRIKQKKLPLSICSSKDQSNPDEDRMVTKSSLIRARTDKPIDRVTPVEVPPTWKCQDFKVSQCLKQDKVVHS